MSQPLWNISLAAQLHVCQQMHPASFLTQAGNIATFFFPNDTAKELLQADNRSNCSKIIPFDA